MVDSAEQPFPRLIAIMWGTLEMTGGELVEEFVNLSKAVFLEGLGTPQRAYYKPWSIREESYRIAEMWTMTMKVLGLKSTGTFLVVRGKAERVIECWKLLGGKMVVVFKLENSRLVITTFLLDSHLTWDFHAC
ncbi:hypothetical protein DL96DRAFT_1685164 [Flagelloscypha sp. PMI_526]|nr:hypothetical protein DL96DRAFT_1685164 [Flagelloscypha sp. PMI_526]